MVQKLEKMLTRLEWLDPTIPIALARQIREDQADSVPDSLDKLLPASKYTRDQVEEVKEIVRQLADLSSLHFHNFCERIVTKSN